jgi:general stress protein 26
MADAMTLGAGEVTARQEMLAKVGELIEDMKIAMLTTVAHDGALHSRPMATQQSTFDGTLWFFTGLSTDKASELERNPEVNLAYAEPADMKFVSLSGRGEILRDRMKARELWSDVYKAWFPQGLDDPDLCLLKVEVSSAEYWEAPSGKMVQIVGFLKALATGERARGGDHGGLDTAPEAA